MATSPTHKTARSALGVSTAALLLAAAAAAPAYASGHGNGTVKSDGHGRSDTATTKTKTAPGHNPPGNNGTVFIHDVAGDTSPHNVPHVGCTFYVDFFNFDADQQVTVSFAGQAPTGKDTPLAGTWSGTVSTDDASGAGNDFDLELPFSDTQLGVTDLGAPAHQGYHVKMTLVTNQPGDHKYKVFWMQPCAAAGATTLGELGQSGQVGQSSASATVVQAATANRPTSRTPAATSQIPTEVLGRSITRGTAPTAVSPAASTLPFTGAEIGGLAAAAAVAIGGGLALLVIGRRRRSTRNLTVS